MATFKLAGIVDGKGTGKVGAVTYSVRIAKVLHRELDNAESKHLAAQMSKCRDLRSQTSTLTNNAKVAWRRWVDKRGDPSAVWRQRRDYLRQRVWHEECKHRHYVLLLESLVRRSCHLLAKERWRRANPGLPPLPHRPWMY
jgi:hypothetical protein